MVSDLRNDLMQVQGRMEASFDEANRNITKELRQQIMAGEKARLELQGGLRQRACEIEVLTARVAGLVVDLSEAQESRSRAECAANEAECALGAFQHVLKSKEDEFKWHLAQQTSNHINTLRDTDRAQVDAARSLHQQEQLGLAREDVCKARELLLQEETHKLRADISQLQLALSQQQLSHVEALADVQASVHERECSIVGLQETVTALRGGKEALEVEGRVHAEKMLEIKKNLSDSGVIIAAYEAKLAAAVTRETGLRDTFQQTLLDAEYKLHAAAVQIDSRREALTTQLLQDRDRLYSEVTVSQQQVTQYKKVLSSLQGERDEALHVAASWRRRAEGFSGDGDAPLQLGGLSGPSPVVTDLLEQNKFLREAIAQMRIEMERLAAEPASIMQVGGGEGWTLQVLTFLGFGL